MNKFTTTLRLIFSFYIVILIYIFFVFSNIYSFQNNTNLECTDYGSCFKKGRSLLVDNDFNSFIYLYKSLSLSTNDEQKETTLSYLSNVRNNLYDIGGSLFFLKQKSINSYTCSDIKSFAYLNYQNNTFDSGIDSLLKINKTKECGMNYLLAILYFGKGDYINSKNYFQDSYNYMNLYNNKEYTKIFLDNFIIQINKKILSPGYIFDFNFKNKPNFSTKKEEKNNFNYNGENRPFVNDNEFIRYFNNLKGTNK